MIPQFVNALAGASNANTSSTGGAVQTGNLALIQQLVQQFSQIAILSSVAIYQSNRSLFMVNLSPIANLPQDPHVNSDIFSRFDGTGGLLRFTDVGFACDHNNPLPTNLSSFVTQCYLGDWGIPPELSIIKKSWKYDQRQLQSNATINQIDDNVCKSAFIMSSCYKAKRL